MTSRPAVFLDRDGTLIEERHYPVRDEDLVLLPGVGPGLQRLASAGFLRIVVTNQSAVARGLVDEERLGRLHARLAAALAAAGGAWDALYYCPHHPEGTDLAYRFACGCRKPGRLLLDLAVAEHDIDLGRSVAIGDSPRDLFPGVELGTRILVESGHPLSDRSAADHVAPDLPAAIEWMLTEAGITS